MCKKMWAKRKIKTVRSLWKVENIYVVNFQCLIPCGSRDICKTILAIDVLCSILDLFMNSNFFLFFLLFLGVKIKIQTVENVHKIRHGYETNFQSLDYHQSQDICKKRDPLDEIFWNPWAPNTRSKPLDLFVRLKATIVNF